MKMALLVALAAMMGATSVGAQQEIIIKALVDGPSDFIVTTNGFQWRNGANAKPGRHEGRNEPTYIDDQAWLPQWGKPQEDRGVDVSDPFPWSIANLDLDFELLAIGETPDTTTVEPRTAPTISFGMNSLIINIPDPEPGSRWYVFSLSSGQGSEEQGAKR